MKSELFTREYIDSFPKRQPHKDARLNFVARNNGEALVDFLNRIDVVRARIVDGKILKRDISFELVTRRLDVLMAKVEIKPEELETVSEYEQKLAQLDPPIEFERTGEIENGRRTIAANFNVRGGATSISVILEKEGPETQDVEIAEAILNP